MSNELTKVESAEMVATTSYQSMLGVALQNKATPETLAKLMDLQERYEANEAKKAYTEAMAAFKCEVPSVIPKDSLVDFTSNKGRTHYRHATLGSISAKVTGILSKHGLSVGWETEQLQGAVKVTCHVTHAKGHRESTSLSGPPDVSGNKNPIQQIGSAVTYLQRYTMLAALGLATADQDDADNPMPTAAQATQPPAQQPSANAQAPLPKTVTGLIEQCRRTKKDNVEWVIFDLEGEQYATKDKGAMDKVEGALEITQKVEVAYYIVRGKRIATAVEMIDDGSAF